MNIQLYNIHKENIHHLYAGIPGLILSYLREDNPDNKELVNVGLKLRK